MKIELWKFIPSSLFSLALVFNYEEVRSHQEPWDSIILNTASLFLVIAICSRLAETKIRYCNHNQKKSNKESCGNQQKETTPLIKTGLNENNNEPIEDKKSNETAILIPTEKTNSPQLTTALNLPVNVNQTANPLPTKKDDRWPHQFSQALTTTIDTLFIMFGLGFFFLNYAITEQKQHAKNVNKTNPSIGKLKNGIYCSWNLVDSIPILTEAATLYLFFHNLSRSTMNQAQNTNEKKALEYRQPKKSCGHTVKKTDEFVLDDYQPLDHRPTLKYKNPYPPNTLA